MKRLLAGVFCVFFLACSDDADAPETKAGDVAPEGGKEEKAAEAPVDGEALESLVAGVTVLESGKAPAQLMAPVLGEPRQLVLVLSGKSGDGKKAPAAFPPVRLAVSSALSEKSATGAKRSWAIGDARVSAQAPFDDGAATKVQATLAGAGAGGLLFDEYGALAQVPGFDAAVAPTKEIAESMRLVLSHMALPLPGDAMGVGAKFVIKRQISIGGEELWETLDCKLERREGEQIQVNADLKFARADHAEVGTGTLKARYHLPSATAIDLKLEVDLNLADRERRRLHIFEDYLAQPDPRVALSGEFVSGGLVHGRLDPKAKVWVNRTRVKVSPEGDFVFGFGRDASPQQRLSFKLPGGNKERHVIHVARREFEPEVIDGLPEELVKLAPETRKALAKSKKRVEKVRGKSSKEAHFAKGFRWPLRGKITSTYGRKRTLNGKEKGYHWGVDVAAPVGKKVKSPSAGVVVFAEEAVPLSGHLLIVDHGHGLTSSFLHLSKFKVAVGDKVRQGQVVALSGNTGRSTGPHLDWRMNWFDKRIDPEMVVKIKRPKAPEVPDVVEVLETP